MTGKTILLVEDNPKVMRNNSNMLKGRGAKVLSAANLAEARRILDTAESEKTYPDIAVIDIMLPDGSGLDLLKEIRSGFKSTGLENEISKLPVLLLTAKGETDDIVHGFSSGADDYLAKPYQMKIFAARLEALLRRTQSVKDSLSIGRLRFDLINNQVFYSGKDLALSQTEFALLFLLAQSEGKILSAEYLYKKVWKEPFMENPALRVRISSLKKKLAELNAEILIENEWGGGYCLKSL